MKFKEILIALGALLCMGADPDFVNHILPPAERFNSQAPSAPTAQVFIPVVPNVPRRTFRPYVPEVLRPSPALPPEQLQRTDEFYPYVPAVPAASQPPALQTQPPAQTFVPQPQIQPRAQEFRPW